jgi:hypothetical protein
MGTEKKEIYRKRLRLIKTYLDYYEPLKEYTEDEYRRTLNTIECVCKGE